MKPLRPFPLPIRVGTDICQISRVFGIVVSGRGGRFVDRVLTKREQESEETRLQWLKARHDIGIMGELQNQANAAGAMHEVMAKKEPEIWSLSAFLAGRFAAKEAAIKAHPHRHLTFHDVSIERMPPLEDGVRGVKKRLGSGPPVVRIAAEEGEDEDGSAMVSISHDGDYATAVCIGYEAGA